MPGFARVQVGPAGGTVWKGTVPGESAGARGRPTFVYLPPGYSPSRRYPVAYLLHGMPGGPTSYVYSLHLAERADALIASGRTRPFIAVCPPAGTHHGYYSGEWAGVWEDYLVRRVVPWVDTNLPTVASAAGRVLAGLSAGGFGAVSIGLRHLGVFGVLESWSGYFHPFADGPLAHADRAVLDRHDPTLLVRRKAAAVRRLGVRFELSTGVAHGAITPALTAAFARELASFGLPVAVWHVPASVRTPDYGDQLTHGLAFAFAPPAHAG